MKKSCFVVFLISLIFVSCASDGVVVPGSAKMSENSLHYEYLNLGDAYSELKKYDKAADYYKLASKKKDLYWSSTYKLAYMYALQSKWDEALPLYEKLLSRDPENMSLKESVAYVHAMKGDYEKSLKIYGELLEYFPDSQEILENYISILITKEDLDKALEFTFILEKKFPDNTKLSKFKEILIVPEENNEASESTESEPEASDENSLTIDSSESL